MRDMTRRLLLWIERGLFLTGAGLALWCGIVLIEAEYFSRLPVPPPQASAAVRLPGETSDFRPRRGPIPAGTWIARLEAPTVQLSATVLEGSDDRTLARAAGHIEETSLPGAPGNVGIAGHRDTTFRRVRNLHVGDPLVVTTADHVLHYRIRALNVVEPENVSVLDPLDHPTVTLVTCYPFEFFGHAPQRFIVSADLVTDQARIAHR
jgi:sortase A